MLVHKIVVLWVPTAHVCVPTATQRACARSTAWSTYYLRSSKPLDYRVFKSWWAWVLVGKVGLNFKTMSSMLWPLVAMKITVATGSVKSSMPIATVIGPDWQRLNVATGTVTTSAHYYYVICVKIWRLSLPYTKRDCPQNLLHWILSLPAIACQWAHVRARMPTDMHCKQKEDWVEWKAIRHLRSSHIVVGL
jgi:hypothetical protein